MKTVRKIEAKAPLLNARRKVAAYARVSMETERLSHSLSAQVSYYSGMIQKNPDWEYAGVYSDDFITGTKAVKRNGFLQMIDDCEEGKIQLILTKSISRFARNTVDLLTTVRHLKDIGVEVWFEKENIHTFDGDGELMLSILASFAQEESESISNNVKWSIKKKFEQGIPNGHFIVYGYRWEGDELVIIPEEAEVVRRIFQNFLDGKSTDDTVKAFAAEGITTRKGRKWVDSTIKAVLMNNIYTGDLVLQKTFRADPISQRKVINRGELPRYSVNGHHEAIIDKETFDYVQSEMARRAEAGVYENKSHHLYFFSGKIKCPYCGCSYVHRKRIRNGHEQEFWCCATTKKTASECLVKGQVNQKSLLKASAEVLGLDEFSEDVYTERIDHIEVPEKHKLLFFFKDGHKVMQTAPNTGHQDCWTPELRAETSRKHKGRPKVQKKKLYGGEKDGKKHN